MKRGFKKIQMNQQMKNKEKPFAKNYHSSSLSLNMTSILTISAAVSHSAMNDKFTVVMKSFTICMVIQERASLMSAIQIHFPFEDKFARVMKNKVICSMTSKIIPINMQ